MSELWIEVVNLDKIINGLAVLGAEVISAAAEATQKETEIEFKLTQHRVPWHTGELSRSGRTTEVDIESDELTAGIAYGGPAGVSRNVKDVDYAVIVHEDLMAVHLFGRSAKYVENVVREELESGRAAERMSATIRGRMGW